MPKTKTTHQTAKYQIKSQDEHKIVYSRVVPSKGRTEKQINSVVAGLPTATLYTFTKDEFNKLKSIESQIYSELEIIDNSRSWKDKLLSFLEI